MKFSVQLEATIRKEVEVEADSYEEAVAKVVASRPKGTAELRPTWVDESAYVESNCELRYEVLGPCGRCKKQMVQRSIPGQSYTYTSDPDNEHADSICYDCAEKAKAETA